MFGGEEIQDIIVYDIKNGKRWLLDEKLQDSIPQLYSSCVNINGNIIHLIGGLDKKKNITTNKVYYFNMQYLLNSKRTLLQKGKYLS